MDVVTLGAALNGSKKYTDQVGQSLESNLSSKANVSDVNTATANLQTQINQIAQAAGTGSADTEVAQARVGADGTSYQTLKARLDSENSELKEDLSNFKQITDNLFPSSVADWTQGMPQATTMLRRCYSKPISVQSGSTLYVYGKYIEALNADVLRIAQSDDAGNIDASTWTTFDFNGIWKGITYTVPTGTSYIVFVLDSGSETKPVTPESVKSLKMYVGVSEITSESQWYPDVKMYTYDDLYKIFNKYSSEFSSIERKFGVYGINSSTNEFEKDGNDLYWKAREFYIRGMALKTISSSDFTTETTPSGKTGYVKIPNNSALVYNVSTESVSVISTTKLSNNIIPIFSVLLGRVVGGIGAYLYQKWELDNATSSNANLDTYWKTFLDDRMPTLHAKDIECGSNGDSFIWVTDVHVSASTLKSPMLIKYIVDNSSTSSVFCGGDILSKDASKNVAIERLYTWQNLVRNLSPITVRGNHDANSEDNSDISLHISDKEFYSIFCKEIESSINTEKKLYYYKDNNSQKIRYIFLDTGCPDSNVIDSTQIAWMKSKISELNEGWFAIVICHQFYSGQTIASGITELPKDGNGTAIMNALDEIYDSVSATIIGVISGHCHRDYVSYSAKGYPMIATTCDARQASTYDINFPERIVGTTTECAFDVFHINTMTRNIYSTRIGAGGSDGDRIFTF